MVENSLLEMIMLYFPSQHKSCLKELAHNDGKIVEAEEDISVLVKKQRGAFLQSVSPSQLSYNFFSTDLTTTFHNKHSKRKEGDTVFGSQTG